MKIKLFYQKYRQSVEKFEKEVNDFMTSVEVIDVKFTEATTGHYEQLETYTGLLLVYKEAPHDEI